MKEIARTTRITLLPGRWLVAGVALVSVVLLGAACASGSSTSGPAPTDSPVLDTRPADVADNGAESEIEGGDEPLFVYQGADLLGGDELTFAQVFELGKPVVLNFWAGLCPPCRQEMPDFQEVYDERQDEFLVLGVDVGEFTGLGSQDDAKELLDELGITYPAAYVDSNALLREYDVFVMPTTVFMTARGDIVSKNGGFLSGDEIRDLVQTMIDASG